MTYIFNDPEEGGKPIEAEDEDELVQKVQKHMKQEHGKDIPKSYIEDNISQE